MIKANPLKGSAQYVILLAFFGIISCTTPHYMYVPTAANNPGFTKKNESSLNLALSANGTDLQAGYAISDHVALLGSWYWRKERQYDKYYHDRPFGVKEKDSIRYYRNLLSLGMAVSMPMDEHGHFFFLISGGYGTGRFRMAERDFKRQSASDSTAPAHFTSYHSRTSRAYLQPGVMMKFSPVKLILSMRWSGIAYHYRSSTDDLESFGIKDNSLYSFIEPAMTLRITPPRTDWLSLELQSGVALPSSSINFDYRGFIGNIGIGIDPVRLLGGHGQGNAAPETH